jgi:hypothetical protein
MATETERDGITRKILNGMQWRKESLLALKGSRSRFTVLGKGKLWLVTELRLTGRERKLLLCSRLSPESVECPVLADNGRRD